MVYRGCVRMEMAVSSTTKRGQRRVFLSSHVKRAGMRERHQLMPDVQAGPLPNLTPVWTGSSVITLPGCNFLLPPDDLFLEAVRKTPGMSRRPASAANDCTHACACLSDPD